MEYPRIALLLAATSCVLLAAGPTSSYAWQQGGAVAQPGAQEPGSDPDAEVKALVNSPEARSVAAFRCSTAQPDCPLAESMSKVLEDRFDDTLLTGQGASTALITTLENLLKASYGNDAIWPVGVSYAIVHLVKFSGDTHRDRWLLFNRSKGKVTASSDTRIMGSKRVAVVFVHLGVDVTIEKLEEVETEGVRKVAKTAIAPFDAASALYANVEYRAIAKPKLPINIQRLLGLLKIAAGLAQGEERLATRTMAMLGFGVYTDMPVPSDLTVFGVRVGDTPQGFGRPITYDNEGKYFWDASVAVPINKITLLDYDEENGTFTPKVINKQSIYGVIDIYPFPVDIKAGTMRWLVPRAMVGIGMTGRPGENFLLAGAFGIKEFQVFIGSAFANQRVLKPGADPANGENYTQRYASRLTYGINVPVLSALKKLGGSD